MKISGIYKITSPTNKIYIGQSVDIHKRWKVYFSLNCRAQRFIYNSLRKHGVKKHKFEIIHVCYEVELNQAEEYYIKKFNTRDGENGLNLLYSKIPKEKDKREESLEDMRKAKKAKYMKQYNFKKQKLQSINTQMFWREVKRGNIKLPNLLAGINCEYNATNDSSLPF